MADSIMIDDDFLANLALETEVSNSQIVHTAFPEISPDVIAFHSATSGPAPHYNCIFPRNIHLRIPVDVLKEYAKQYACLGLQGWVMETVSPVEAKGVVSAAWYALPPLAGDVTDSGLYRSVDDMTYYSQVLATACSMGEAESKALAQRMVKYQKSRAIRAYVMMKGQEPIGAGALFELGYDCYYVGGFAIRSDHRNTELHRRVEEGRRLVHGTFIAGSAIRFVKIILHLAPGARLLRRTCYIPIEMAINMRVNEN